MANFESWVRTLRRVYAARSLLARNAMQSTPTSASPDGGVVAGRLRRVQNYDKRDNELETRANLHQPAVRPGTCVCPHEFPVQGWERLTAGSATHTAAGSLVSFIEPLAAGSGIPELKTYLNGVRIPGLLHIRTIIAKLVGIMFSIASGLIAGKVCGRQNGSHQIRTPFLSQRAQSGVQSHTQRPLLVDYAHRKAPSSMVAVSSAVVSEQWPRVHWASAFPGIGGETSETIVTTGGMPPCA
eukprot:scaffold451_cov365-Prasinococcus_capsulatus_cf.AAC.37